MKFKIKSAPKQGGPTPGPSLADQINAARSAAEAYVQAKVDEQKASPDASSLPRDWIFLNTYAVAGADRVRCPCRCALNLLSQKDDQP